MAKTYKTVLGDTWDIIAHKLYGDDHDFECLIDANPLYTDTLIFSAGVELTIPEEPYNTPGAVLTDQANWREVMANG